MPDRGLRVVARIVARPGREGALREILAGLVEPTRRERGCRQYVMLQNREDPGDFTFVEEWETEQALESHLASPHVAKALGAIGDLVASEPEIRRYDVVA